MKLALVQPVLCQGWYILWPSLKLMHTRTHTLTQHKYYASSEVKVKAPLKINAGLPPPTLSVCLSLSFSLSHPHTYCTHTKQSCRPSITGPQWVFCALWLVQPVQQQHTEGWAKKVIPTIHSVRGNNNHHPFECVCVYSLLACAKQMAYWCV